MQLNITFRGIDSSEALKSHIRDRIEGLSKHLDRDVESHTVLSLERYLQHAEISIHAGPFTMRGTSKSEDMYKSIDEAVEKIERQLKRYKGRLRNHKLRVREATMRDRLARHNVVEITAPEQDEGESWAQGPRLIRSAEFPLLKLTVDEAVMQMDLMNNDFLVFIDVAALTLSVVYRRKDGHFGLIETPKAA